MAEKKSSTELTSAQKVGIGVGLTAAAAAAGAYFLYGSKDAAKNRKRVKGWMHKAKGEVIEALETAGKITKEEYAALVEAASGMYGTAQRASRNELKEFKDEMESHWKTLQRSGVIKKIVAPAKKAAKKAQGTAKKAPTRAKKTT